VPSSFLFAGDLNDGGELRARMSAPAPAAALAPRSWAAMALKREFEGATYRLSIEQRVAWGAGAAFKPQRARVMTS
jgi:hypothetical protein